MTSEELDKLTDEMIKEVLKMRDTKGKEYANSDIDRLANFKEVAKECGVLPLQVWEIYFKKHVRAIDNYVKTGSSKSTETIKSRFVDAITYLLLGYGLVVEGIKEKPFNNATLSDVKYYLNHKLPAYYYTFQYRRSDGFVELLRFSKEGKEIPTGELIITTEESFYDDFVMAEIGNLFGTT